MASYQDIETRLRVVEDKLDFVMKTMAMTARYEHPLAPGQVVTETRTLLDIYRGMKSLAMTPEEITETPESPSNPLAETVNG